MKIEVTRAFYHDREPQAVGTVLDVDDRYARELIHMGKAAPAAERPEPAPARATRAKAKEAIE